MVMFDGWICFSSFKITGKIILLGIGRVMSQTLIPIFCPGSMDFRRGRVPMGFRSAALIAPSSSGNPGIN